jgi:ribonuclease HI
MIDLFGYKNNNKINKNSKQLNTINLFGENYKDSKEDSNVDNNYIFGCKNKNKTQINNTLYNESNSDNMFEAFTDGSTFNNGKKNKIQFGGIGIYFPNDKHLNISECLYGKITNNIAELKAIIRAIDYFINHNNYSSEKQIYIYSDSEYTINCVIKWSKTWEKNGWKKRDKKDVCNKDLIIKLYNYYKKYKIKFIHVKAHTKEPKDLILHQIWYGNMMADKLATESSKKSQKEFYNCKGLSSKSKSNSLFD